MRAREASRYGTGPNPIEAHCGQRTRGCLPPAATQIWWLYIEASTTTVLQFLPLGRHSGTSTIAPHLCSRISWSSSCFTRLLSPGRSRSTPLGSAHGCPIIVYGVCCMVDKRVSRRPRLGCSRKKRGRQASPKLQPNCNSRPTLVQPLLGRFLLFW